VAREAGRRRLRRLLIAGTLVALVGAAAGATLSPLLDVDRVVVVGVPNAAEVRAAADVSAGAPLLLVDTGAIADRVRALPWVREVHVGRELPGTLRIAVRSRAPVAFAPRPDGQVALVDETATVTALASTPPSGLPALVTTKAPRGPGSRISPAGSAEVAAAVGPLGGRVARVSVEGDAAALLLADGHEVRLGVRSNLAEKVRSAAAVLDAANGEPFKYVDVRVPSAPVTG
jgi:cell division protein FtsQ